MKVKVEAYERMPLPGIPGAGDPREEQSGPGTPGSLTLSGNIQPDGKATIDASGTVGDPSNTANRLRTGTPYAYKVDALFDGTRGVGNRIELRPCTLTFVK